MIGHDTLRPEECAYRDECDAFLSERLDPELVGREVEGSPVARRRPERV